SEIPMGVEIAPVLRAQRSQQFREQFGIRLRSKVVGMVGYLRPQKDPLTFVEAAALVAKKDSDVMFLMCGDGELCEAIARGAEKNLTRENFQQIGWQTGIPEFLVNLDLLVLPSLWEGLPRVIPE